MSEPMADLVCFFDVDNTLLNNDGVQEDLSAHLDASFGRVKRDRYWAIFEELRVELGYADYLGALQRYRLENLDDPQILQMSSFLIDYPFPTRLYPGALEAVAQARSAGVAAVLSDGDVVFQPHKILRSGIWDAVGGQVLIYLHKEQMLDAVAQRHPARHYVMVDDKLRILAAMKQRWGDRLTTIFVRQGHYALDAHEVAKYSAADISLEHIGELRKEHLTS